MMEYYYSGTDLQSSGSDNNQKVEMTSIEIVKIKEVQWDVRYKKSGKNQDKFIEKYWSRKVGYMQVPNGMVTGVRRSERPLMLHWSQMLRRNFS